MTPEQLEKRRRVMRRSMTLGHCICDPHQPCPCDEFKQKGFCHCAGERPATMPQKVRLTEHVRNAGCASKISKNVLKEVLHGLPEVDDPRVLVGAAAGDDAGVMVLSESDTTATIMTVDVFCPSVDDPYTFGQIAAANSLSDIYAMGGKPQAALSIIGFPVSSLPLSAMREILRGGADKMREAGVPIVGGHSINDEEIKCGFAVIGTAPRERFVRNSGAQVGDMLVLTKPLGSGIVIFGHQIGRSTPEQIASVAQSAATLNRVAGELMIKHGAHAATDVTGFSLLGHLVEIVKNSQIEISIDFGALPLFDGALALAQQDAIPGAVERNRESVERQLVDVSQLADAQQAILYCPETSGGMLIALPQEKVDAFLRDFSEQMGRSAAVVGRVTRTCAGGMIRVAGSKREPEHQTKDVVMNQNSEDRGSCCCDAAGHQPEQMGIPAAAGADAFKTYMAAINGPGALGVKEKKLISLALSIVSKCEPCVTINVKAARDAGASDAEISEAAALGIAFGGASCAMFYNTLRSKS